MDSGKWLELELEASDLPEGHGMGTLSLLVCEQDTGVIGSGMVLWMESLAGLTWGLSGQTPLVPGTGNRCKGTSGD